jgi:hypothetical protein
MVQNKGLATGIRTLATAPEASASGPSYNLSGQRVNASYKGIIIKRSAEGRMQGKNGKKVFNKRY